MLESKKKSIAEQQNLKDTLAFCMNYDQPGVFLFLCSVFNETQTQMIRAAWDILRTKEDNLKQMNAIYDSNPNILQDFHSALQNGISVDFQLP